MTAISSLDESYHYCEQLAFSHYENFPVASWLIPRDKRKHVAAIYAFARIADDYADEPGLTQEDRLQKLRDWETRLSDCYRGVAVHPVFVALGDTARRFQIPQNHFQDLLAAFRSDVTVRRYESFDDVLAYCGNSANPVGRLVLLLFGYKDEQMAGWSDKICTALQLTNFWQDLSIDLDKDRVYIPLEDFRQFNLEVQDIQRKRFSPAFRALMEFEVQRTRELFEQGKPLLANVGKDLSLEMKLTWLGGTHILEKISRLGYNVLDRRPTLSFVDKSSLLLRALIWIYPRTNITNSE
ncbi:MAG: squalene synthase HpnC [Bacteroidota bacterium]